MKTLTDWILDIRKQYEHAEANKETAGGVTDWTNSTIGGALIIAQSIEQGFASVVAALERRPTAPAPAPEAPPAVEVRDDRHVLTDTLASVKEGIAMLEALGPLADYEPFASVLWKFIGEAGPIASKIDEALNTETAP